MPVKRAAGYGWKTSRGPIPINPVTVTGRLLMQTRRPALSGAAGH